MRVLARPVVIALASIRSPVVAGLQRLSESMVNGVPTAVTLAASNTSSVCCTVQATRVTLAAAVVLAGIAWANTPKNPLVAIVLTLGSAPGSQLTAIPMGTSALLAG